MKLKDKRKKSQNSSDIIYKIAIFIEKHIIWFVISLGIMIFIIPILLWLFSSIIDLKIPCSIPVGDVLAYNGTIVGSISSFTIAIVALSQSKRNELLQSRIESIKRQDSIKPYIQVSFKKENNEKFSISITNNGMSSAFQIMLYEKLLFYCINPYKTETKTFNSEELQAFFEDSNKKIPFSKTGVPKMIYLQYRDLDSNDIYQEFIYVENDFYEPQRPEYTNFDYSDYYEEEQTK